MWSLGYAPPFTLKMDGQAELMNQVTEQYLRIYPNYQQNNWFNILALVEFSYNKVYQSTIEC